nr:hypothetical transcript [Hymenolepis microstoma]
MESVLRNSIRFGGPLGSQQLMRARVSQPSTMINEFGRQYTSHNPCGSQDEVVTQASKQNSVHTDESGRQFTSTELTNPPVITSQYASSTQSFEQSGI